MCVLIYYTYKLSSFTDLHLLVSKRREKIECARACKKGRKRGRIREAKGTRAWLSCGVRRKRRKRGCPFGSSDITTERRQTGNDGTNCRGIRPKYLFNCIFFVLSLWLGLLIFYSYKVNTVSDTPCMSTTDS